MWVCSPLANHSVRCTRFLSAGMSPGSVFGSNNFITTSRWIISLRMRSTSAWCIASPPINSARLLRSALTATGWLSGSGGRVIPHSTALSNPLESRYGGACYIIPENARCEVQNPRRLRPDLVPRADALGDHRVDEPCTAAERRDRSQREARVPDIVGSAGKPERAKPDQEDERDHEVGDELEDPARQHDVELGDQRQLQQRPVVRDRVDHVAAGVDEDVIGQEAREIEHEKAAAYRRLAMHQEGEHYPQHSDVQQRLDHGPAIAEPRLAKPRPGLADDQRVQHPALAAQRVEEPRWPPWGPRRVLGNRGKL